MPKGYGTIFGRVGIILLLTAIVITLVGHLRSTNRLDISTINYIGVGLAVVGVILLLVFVIEFVSNKIKKHLTRKNYLCFPGSYTSLFRWKR